MCPQIDLWINCFVMALFAPYSVCTTITQVTIRWQLLKLILELWAMINIDQDNIYYSLEIDSICKVNFALMTGIWIWMENKCLNCWICLNVANSNKLRSRTPFGRIHFFPFVYFKAPQNLKTFVHQTIIVFKANKHTLKGRR